MTLDQWLALVGALKWPVTAVIALVILRGPFAEVIRGFKNRSLSYRDTQIAAEQQAQTALPTPAPTPIPVLPNGVTPPAVLPSPVSEAAATAKAPVTFLFEADDNPYITAMAAVVKDSIQSRIFTSNEEREKWLWREGAKLEIRIEFEKFYRTMFQSQLATLYAANNLLQNGGISREIAAQAYNEASKRYPDFYKTYPYESWLKYLTNNALLAAKEDRFVITNKGHLYLHYLLQEGYGTRANSPL